MPPKIPNIIENSIAYWGWDFGFLAPAALFAQRNTKDQWLFLREFIGDHIAFDVFCKLVLTQANTLYTRKNMQEIHFIDPAGMQRYHQKGESGASCDAHEIRIQWNREYIDGTEAQVRRGVQEIGDRKQEGPRIKECRKLLKLRADDNYGEIIHPLCGVLIDGMTGGYVFDKYGKPIKNRFSHICDCKQYIVTGYNRMTDPGAYAKKKGQTSNYKPIGLGTGM